MNKSAKFLKQILPVKLTIEKFRLALMFLLLLLAVCVAESDAAPQAGDVDPNFNVQIQTNSFSNKSVSLMLTLPDDKMLATGGFNSFNRQPVSGLIRLTADGLLDTTFNNNLLAPGSYVSKLYVQPDGKIFLVGYNYKLNGSTAPAASILRLNADGTIDSTFNFFGGGSPVYSAAIAADGKVLVAGAFSFTVNGVSANKFLVRLNSDGTIDNTFNYEARSVSMVVLQNDKPIILSYDPQTSQEMISRLNADGSVDSSFTRIPSNHYGIDVIKTAPDNKILVLGQQTLQRYNADGSVDNGFQPTTTSREQGRDLYIGGDGRITYSVRANSYTGTQVRRVLANGAPDPSFTTFNRVGSFASAVQSDSEIFLGDTSDTSNGTSIVNQYTHLFGSGAPDTAFNSGGVGFQNINPGSIGAIVVQPDRKIIMAGKFDLINNVNRSKIARLNSDNTIDNSFQINTSAAAGNYFSQINEIYTLSLQPGGKIFVTGSFTYVLNGANKVNVVRLNADGSIDPTFNIGVYINDFYGASRGGKNKLATQNDGKILIATSRGGSGSTTIPTRLASDGAKDAGFNPTLYSAFGVFAYDIAVQPDQKILIGGAALGTSPTGFVVRLNADGSVDQTFQKNEDPGKAVAALNLLANGKILIVKGNIPYYSTTQSAVSRLNADGSADATFAAGAGANGIINATLLMPNGQILVGGNFTTFNGAARQNLALINADGTLDATVYTVNQEVLSLALDVDNRILVGGSFTTISVNSGQSYARSFVARLTELPQTAGRRARFDFDGDGRADLATFTDSSGVWSILSGQASAARATQFGQNGDRTAAADFDNDGKTDIAVYRPAQGVWYLMQSTAGFAAARWGAAEDKPVPADFDGDGGADIAVWRPSNGVWYIARTSAQQTSAQYVYYQFGTAGDVPVPADYDGDGRADVAVFRPSNGTFYWLASASGNQFKAVQFGQNGDIPAVADYNGDGQADLAVFRPSNGFWYLYLTDAGGNYTFSAVQFGQNGDEPVAADYDGDGKTDIAVRRQAIWYLLKSSQGYSSAAFGSANTQAVAALPNQ